MRAEKFTSAVASLGGRVGAFSRPRVEIQVLVNIGQYTFSETVGSNSPPPRQHFLAYRNGEGAFRESHNLGSSRLEFSTEML
jgi:hypothetical protein